MSEDDCNCASKCPDYAHCVCIYDIKTGKCGYSCSDSVAGVNLSEPVLKVALDSRVNVRMNGATLAEAGRLLADLTDAEIFVPASQLDERRDLYLMDASLDTVVRELSLMAVVRP
jgi:hypothetical protein